LHRIEIAMALHARNNRTPAGAKRRWTADDRAKRETADPSASRTGRGPRPVEGAPASRAARRDAAFGADRSRRTDERSGPDRSRRTDERGGVDRRPRAESRSGDDRRPDDGERGGRQDRRTDWYPGPRTNPRRPERGARDDRPRGDRPAYGDRRDRGDRPQRDDRSPRQYGGAREDRPQRSDRPTRSFRADAPASRRPRSDGPQRIDRPQWSDRPLYGDRASERPQYGGRAERADRPRGDRPERSERPSSGDRPQRSGRPEHGNRPERSDRPHYGDRPQHSDRPQRGERHERSDRSRFQDDARPAWTPPEDVVLEHLQGEVVTAEDVAGVTFADLGLGEGITKALTGLGAVSPFPIQAATIPDAIAGRNVLGRGRTGSGKTIAFGAALVERLMRNWHESGRSGTGRRMGRAPRALILAPTRELALQIDRTVQPIARSVGLYTTQIVGGVPQARQVGALGKGVDIVIGTPGRVEDLLEQRRLDLGEIEITVLDEADHMADLGFLEPMQRLLRRVPAAGQRMLFSATLDAAVSTLVDEFLPEPAVHEVADVDGESTAVHRVLVIEQGEKLPVLTALLNSVERTLVFARTRAFAEQLADDLDGAGVRAESLHGDLNQARRSRNLARFSDGKVGALVATDVAARGIHVDDIELVVHADAAEDYKTYLHRSGRTGRAGASGTVVTLITARRRRRFTELLERAGIEADFVAVGPGEDPVEALAR
jgi:superfamily II DNA/RNA helicase